MKKQLIAAVINNKDRISYINLNEEAQYLGWTHDFNIILPDGVKMGLDLNKEEDLFLLFVLASAWSRTGQWENAAFFTTYLKTSKKYHRDQWLDDDFVKNEIAEKDKNAAWIVSECSGVVPRKKVCFRKDIYASIVVIAKNWNMIKEKLELSACLNDYSLFIDYLAGLDGLGTGQKHMRIKIPLILRELRCQGIYPSIPGEFCCVPDERVKAASKELGIVLPTINSIDSLFKASAIIYQQFGELYDIPLFAYEDLKVVCALEDGSV